VTMRLRVAIALDVVLLALSLRAQAPAGVADLGQTLERVGQHVAQFYERARSIVCVETVVIQEITSSFSFDGPSRKLQYELRVEWDPEDRALGGEAKIVRHLIAVGGRPPRSKDKPGCMDPKAEAQDWLAMLLPAHRGEYAFTWAGVGRTDGRPSVMLDYKALPAGPPSIVWTDDCVLLDLPGRSRGRLWIDAGSGDVLRLDSHLTGIEEFSPPRDRRAYATESLVLERADTEVTYRPVAFHDPEETVLLPASILSTTILRSGATSSRVTQTFSDYRRFVTGGRVVKDGG